MKAQDVPSINQKTSHGPIDPEELMDSGESLFIKLRRGAVHAACGMHAWWCVNDRRIIVMLKNDES